MWPTDFQIDQVLALGSCGLRLQNRYRGAKTILAPKNCNLNSTILGAEMEKPLFLSDAPIVQFNICSRVKNELTVRKKLRLRRTQKGKGEERIMIPKLAKTTDSMQIKYTLTLGPKSTQHAPRVRERKLNKHEIIERLLANISPSSPYFEGGRPRFGMWRFGNKNNSIEGSYGDIGLTGRNKHDTDGMWVLGGDREDCCIYGKGVSLSHG